PAAVPPRDAPDSSRPPTSRTANRHGRSCRHKPLVRGYPAAAGCPTEGAPPMATVTLIDDMGVANVGFLIENLGKDAGELHYLRELTQNAFESIIRAGRGEAGRVEIACEEVKGVRKLSITDNGIGMTP